MSRYMSMTCLSYYIYTWCTHEQYIDLRVGLFIVSIDHKLVI